MGVPYWYKVLLLVLLSSLATLGQPGLGEGLHQLSTGGDDFLLGLLDDAVVLIVQRRTQPTFLVLRSDTLWTAQLVQSLLADSGFLPRCTFRGRPLTVVGTLKTSSRSAELALRWWDGKRWSPPEPLSVLNSAAWDGQPALSPDAQWLVFASDRPGGLGGLDLYYSRRLPNGGWGLPQNLGPAINTAADEAMPWFLPDGRLLYASRRSGRWQLSIALPVAPGQWEHGLALPPPISSDADDLTPVLWRDTLLFASNRKGGRGGYDLYAFPLCGPVTVVFVPTSGDSPPGRLTLQLKDSTLHIPASAAFRLTTRAFEHMRVRYNTPCSPPVEVTLTTPCDFFRSVLYWVPLTPPDTVPDIVAEFHFPSSSSYQLPTAEHAWSHLFQVRSALRPSPLSEATSDTWWTAEVHATEQLLDSLVRTLSELLTTSGCRTPRPPQAEITATADSAVSVLYTGPPLSLEDLQLWPGMHLRAQTLALLRAHAVAAELQRRLSPSTLLSWKLTAQLESGLPRATVRVPRAQNKP